MSRRQIRGYVDSDEWQRWQQPGDSDADTIKRMIEVIREIEKRQPGEHWLVALGMIAAGGRGSQPAGASEEMIFMRSSSPAPPQTSETGTEDDLGDDDF